MQGTKERLIYPTKDMPSMHAKSGRAPSEPLPLRWLPQLVTDILARIPTESERNSAVVHGCDQLRVTYTDELTEEEQMRDELASLRDVQQQVVAAMPGPGEPMPPETVEVIRRLLARTNQ